MIILRLKRSTQFADTTPIAARLLLVLLRGCLLLPIVAEIIRGYWARPMQAARAETGGQGWRIDRLGHLLATLVASAEPASVFGSKFNQIMPWTFLISNWIRALTANHHRRQLRRWRRRRLRRHRYNAGNFPNHDVALAFPWQQRRQHRQQLQLWRPRAAWCCCCCCPGHISQPAPSVPIAWATMIMTKMMMMTLLLLLLLLPSGQQLHVGLFCSHFCGCCQSLLLLLLPSLSQLQLLNLSCCCFGWKYSNCSSVNGKQKQNGEHISAGSVSTCVCACVCLFACCCGVGALLAVTRSSVIRKSSTSSYVCICVWDRGEFPHYKRINVSDGRVIVASFTDGKHRESVLANLSGF